MINQHLSRNYGLKLRNRTLDTARMARRLDGNLREAAIGQPYALDKMCERFQIPAHDRHNAAGDAYITAILFLKLRHRLASRGVDSLRALLK
jgi:DNA polymerase-3 subunit epsilon